MALLKPFALKKLTILAFTDPERLKPAPNPQFEAMFNPESIKQSYAIVWAKQQAVGSSGAELTYSRSAPSDLSLDLVLDGTGVDELAMERLFPPRSVTERVKEFLDTTFQYQGSIHEPYYLLVDWGGVKNFKCRFATVEITYTLFDRQGTPLRASLKVGLLSDVKAEELARRENKQSPDVTHSRIVRSGDTLPLLTKEVYGSAEHYLAVARYNALDDFRALRPGQELLFPPLASLGQGAAAGSRP